MKRLLIIDSDIRRSPVLKRILESEPFDIHIANNLRDAMELFLAKAFDLVLMDAGFQKIKKFDIAKWFVYHRSSVRVVLMADKEPDAATGSKTPTSESVARVIQRPIDSVRLIAILKKLLADTGFSGTVNKIELQDYIQMVCLSCLDKSILVYHGVESGRIDMRAGRIVHAALPDQKGEKAFYRILAWSNGQFKEVPPNGATVVSIQKDYRQLLLEAAKYQDERPQAEIGGEQTKKLPIEIAEKVNKVIDPPVYRDTGQKEAIDRGSRPKTNSTDSSLSAIASGRVKPGKKSGPLGRYALVAGVLIVCVSVLIVFWAFRGSKADPYPATQSGEPSPAQEVEPKHSEPEGRKASGDLIPGFMGYNQLPRRVILTIHGSNTIGAELVPALAEEFLKERLGAVDVLKVASSGTSTLQIAGVMGDHLGIIEIEALGSGTGFKGLQNEKCDLAMSSRPIKKEELLALAKFGDLSAATGEHVLGLDGIAVIVHPANPVQQLTLKQVADIFSGKITDWRMSGGKPGLIRIYARDENSGTYDTFKSIVLPKEELATGTRRFDSNAALSEAIAKDPEGIGFVGLPYVRNNKALAVADSDAAVLFPNFFTVGTEDYALARRLFLYAPPNGNNRVARDFIDFALSFKGQEIVAKTGFVDMNIKCFPSNPELRSALRDPAIRKRYGDLIREGKRLSTNFRFHLADARLDNRGIKDLERLVDFLRNNLDKKIVLAGFTDSAGDYDLNQKLALERAKSVGKELTARGMVVQEIIGIGQDLNVATNQTEAGRAKNRRVEVWIR